MLYVEKLRLVAHEVGPFGGQERAMQDFVLDLGKSGVSIDIVAFRVSNEVMSSVTSVKIVPSVPGPFILRFVWFWIYTSLILSFRPRLPTITCGAITSVYSEAIWLHFWHHEHLRKTGWFCAWHGSAGRFCLQSAARFVAWGAEVWSLSVVRTPILIAVSESQARSLQAAYPRRLVLTLPNPVNAKYVPARDSSEDGAKTVLFIGGEWGRKGLTKIARATSLAATRLQSPLQLVILGNGPESALRRLCSLPYITVHHVPWTDDVQKHLERASVMALASKYETFAMAGHEALLAGLPVVTTEVHGLADAVRETGLGVVAKPNVSSLADALESLLRKDNFSMSTRFAMSQLLADKYSPQNISAARRAVVSAVSEKYAIG